MDIHQTLCALVDEYERENGVKPSALQLSATDYDALEALSAQRSPNKPPCTGDACVYHVRGVIVEEGTETVCIP